MTGRRPTRKAAAKKAPARKAPRATYTDEQKTQALELYADHGPAEAGRRTGIPARTISSWAKRAGVQSEAPAKTAAATAQARASLEQRKTDLAHRLIDEANLSLDSLHAPAVERKILALPGKIVLAVDEEGEPDFTSGYVVAEARRDCPTFAEKQTIMTTIAIAVDKVQVLTGGVTARYAVEGDADPQVKSVAADVVSLLEARRRRDAG